VPADLARHAILTPLVFGPEELASGVWQQTVEPVDALFIHAHPDDESLDFAVLMAALGRRGLRIATLLLTDGESGIDRYPSRTVPAGYPAGRLAGETLRTVRVEETRRALAILGSDYYLRAGWRNHPYNRRADELPLDAIMAAWGGEEAVVTQVAQVIAALAPRLVVAPDGPSEAREHFEHEATGVVVRRAIEMERAAGRGPGAYLISVDPFQRELYPDAIAIPRAPWGEDLRAVQGAALSQHHTQADASVIGIRRLLDLPFEYYRVVHWGLEESLDELLGVAGGVRSEATPR
ncbi:MAG: PIG-L family deacetylase, partial [Spirochaetaceae bacterium]